MLRQFWPKLHTLRFHPSARRRVGLWFTGWTPLTPASTGRTRLYGRMAPAAWAARVSPSTTHALSTPSRCWPPTATRSGPSRRTWSRYAGLGWAGVRRSAGRTRSRRELEVHGAWSGNVGQSRRRRQNFPGAINFPVQTVARWKAPARLQDMLVHSV